MKGTHLPLYDGRLQILVEQSDVDAVRHAAREADRSVNSWCRQVIKAALKQRGVEPKAA
jgi:predicted HicB family RNase H-like nuclease